MDNVAYIRLIDLMTGQAARQMKQAVQDCKSRGGLILDLRDNHGGSLAYVIEVANYFLKPGLPVVTTVDSESYKQTEYSKSSADSGIIVDAPMVVLINRETASGAEMLASALKDNHRATIIGERSAGATAVKSIDRLEDGSGMNVTIARWLTSSGKDLSDKGLNPDLNIRLNKSELAAGEGPWWRQEGVLLPNTKQLKDAQLLKAMEEIKKKMVK
jgi:carboxyl-terminal processing protease